MISQLIILHATVDTAMSSKVNDQEAGNGSTGSSTITGHCVCKRYTITIPKPREMNLCREFVGEVVVGGQWVFSIGQRRASRLILDGRSWLCGLSKGRLAIFMGRASVDKIVAAGDEYLYLQCTIKGS